MSDPSDDTVAASSLSSNMTTAAVDAGCRVAGGCKRRGGEGVRCGSSTQLGSTTHRITTHLNLAPAGGRALAGAACEGRKEKGPASRSPRNFIPTPLNAPSHPPFLLPLPLSDSPTRGSSSSDGHAKSRSAVDIPMENQIRLPISELTGWSR